MAAARHNLTRPALLGVGAFAHASDTDRRWNRALAALDRAGARLHQFRVEESAIPHEQRCLAVDDDLDDRFNRLECARLAALARLLRLPAPDLPALAAKIALMVDEAAWELADAQPCLAALKADARRLCHGRSSPRT